MAFCLVQVFLVTTIFPKLIGKKNETRLFFPIPMATIEKQENFLGTIFLVTTGIFHETGQDLGGWRV
jgi:hypothetical protein